MSDLVYPYDAAPDFGTTREVAPGVYWLCMRLPFALDHINLWLLKDGAGWTIVDTGITNDETKQQWERIFAERLGGLPVTRVLCTHFHPDHMGLAGWLCDRWKVDLWMTAGEFYMARSIPLTESAVELEERVEFYRRNGADRASLGPEAMANSYRSHVPVIPTGFRRIAGGAPIEIGGHAWLPIIGRGHAPEHACLWCPDLNVLIGGDILLPRISPNISVRSDEPRGNPLHAYLDSLDGFAEVPADTLILPAHGLPYRGMHARIADLRAHHASRLEKLSGALDTPRSAVESFSLLFRRAITPGITTVFAVGEALAHLHYLEREGMARRATGIDGVWRFSRA